MTRLPAGREKNLRYELCEYGRDIMRFEDWDTGRVQNGNVSLFYRRHGSGHPVVLIHGCPQHSLMWHAIGPKLAENFDVIALDQRGMGMSSIIKGPYDGTARAADVAALLDQAGIDRAHIVGYDFGAQTAASFARDFSDRVNRVSFIEFTLPGFGYEQHMAPQRDWDLNANWQLGLFTIPEMAEFLIHGRERELLSWWFHHFSFSGDSNMAPEHFESYGRTLAKPGALRACIEHYASVWTDMDDNEAFRTSPLMMPVLAMGGEAALGAWLEASWGGVAKDLRTQVIPKAGHWISDENPAYTARALRDFFLEGSQ